MIYLLFYDISANSLRTKVSKLLQHEGFERLQLSVYTSIHNPKKNIELWKKINKLLSDEPTAKLYVVSLSKTRFRNMQIIGKLNIDIDYLLGEKRSLII